VWRDFGNKLPFTDGGIVELDRFFAGGGVSFSHDGFFLDRPNQVVVGFDYDDQDDDRLRFDTNDGAQGTLSFNQNERVRSHGLFVQNQLSLTPNADLTVGARFDEVEFDVTDRFLSDGDDSGTVELDDVSPMLGIAIALSDELSFYSTYSSAFETPTTTEFNNPSGAGGFNPGLEPQVARNLEVGLRGSVNRTHRYEVALFNITVDDELIPFEVPGSPGRDFFVNAGESTRNGLEASLVSQPTDRLRTTLSYTYSDFEFDRFDDGGQSFAGNAIPGTPEHVLFGEVTYEDPRGWFGAFDVIMIDDQFANNANSVISDSYTLSNLRFGFERELNGMTVAPFIGINNVFDETYSANVRINAFGGRFFEPGPDRNLYAGVNLSFDFR
jgi:iron complex outermembrane receptor protein